MAGLHSVPKLSARRPDWELPELHGDLQLAPLDPLHNNTDRIKCPKCGRSRAHYCYDCLQPLVPFPIVELPFRVSIVTHHEEKPSKNTGVQVALLAPGQVDLHSMSQVPDDVDPSRCVVLFPSDTALEVEQLEPDSIDRLFIIDSRWKKAGALMRTETFRSMCAVRLSHTRSAFWRFHTRGVSDEGVCTVEALYFFLEALVKHGKLSDPRFTAPHTFDNLLWYFVYQHQVVQQAALKRLQERGTAELLGQQPQQQEGPGRADTEQGQDQPHQQKPQQQQQRKGQTKQQQQQQQKQKQNPMRQTQKQNEQQQQKKTQKQQQQGQGQGQGDGPLTNLGGVGGPEVSGISEYGGANTLAARKGPAGNGGDGTTGGKQQQQQVLPSGDQPEESRRQLHAAEDAAVAVVAGPAGREGKGEAGGGVVREDEEIRCGPSGIGPAAAGVWEAGAPGAVHGDGSRNDGGDVDDAEGHKAKRART